MPRIKKGDSPNKELRIVLSPEAHARIISQAKLMDQTPASFARQIIMEKVTAFEAANSQRSATDFFNFIKEESQKQEESRT